MGVLSFFGYLLAFVAALALAAGGFVIIASIVAIGGALLAIVAIAALGVYLVKEFFTMCLRQLRCI